MIKLLRTDSTHPDFVELVRHLDAELAERDGADHAFYAQFNKIDKIRHVVLAFHEGRAVACGAIKEFAPATMEVKRMFVWPAYRGQGLAALVLAELEGWARELGCTSCVLETGQKQPEAIRLYQRSGYRVIPNYGQYANMANSVCFAKELLPGGDRELPFP